MPGDDLMAALAAELNRPAPAGAGGPDVTVISKKPE
jgi:hypothetical protein